MVQLSSLKGLAVVAVAVVLVGARTQGPNPQSMSGKMAPPLQVSGWMNAPAKGLSLASLKGKVVVLDFWAYW